MGGPPLRAQAVEVGFLQKRANEVAWMGETFPPLDAEEALRHKLYESVQSTLRAVLQHRRVTFDEIALGSSTVTDTVAFRPGTNITSADTHADQSVSEAADAAL